MEIIIFLTVSPKRHGTAEENLGIEYLASNKKKRLYNIYGGGKRKKYYKNII